MLQISSKSPAEAAAAWVGAFALMLIVATPLVLQAAFRSGEAVAVVFAPWTDRDEALSRVLTADGVLVRGGGVPWVVIARSDDPAFESKLYRAGAWLVGNALIDTACAADKADVTS